MISKTTKKRFSSRKSKTLTANGNVAQYVLPLGNGWVVKASNASKFTFITDTWREAVSMARQLAKSKKSELVVYGRDLSIKERTNYSIK